MEISAKESPSGTGKIGVLELGTNSLKLYSYSDDLESFEPHRLEWDVGFEVYSSRQISEETINATLAQIQALLGSVGIDPARHAVFGIATGAFQFAENTMTLLDRLYDLTGVPVRVLTEKEEASILIEGARKLVSERPGMAFDLGGGSLEMVYLGAGGFQRRVVLPLGAIRIHQLASLSSGEWEERPAKKYIQECFRNVLTVHPLPTIHGTGGPVEAIATVAKSSTITIQELRRIERAARRGGPPEELSPRRRELFLPGLLMVRSLMDLVKATTLHYTRVNLGEVFLSRLRPICGVLRGPTGRSFLLHDLDIFPSEDQSTS